MALWGSCGLINSKYKFFRSFVKLQGARGTVPGPPRWLCWPASEARGDSCLNSAHARRQHEQPLIVVVYVGCSGVFSPGKYPLFLRMCAALAQTDLFPMQVPPECVLPLPNPHFPDANYTRMCTALAHPWHHHKEAVLRNACCPRP